MNRRKISFTVLSIIMAFGLTYIIKNGDALLYIKEISEKFSIANINGFDFETLLLLFQYLIFTVFYQTIDLLKDEPIILLYLSSVIALFIILNIISGVSNFIINRQKKWNDDYDSSKLKEIQ